MSLNAILKHRKYRGESNRVSRYVERGCTNGSCFSLLCVNQISSSSQFNNALSFAFLLSHITASRPLARTVKEYFITIRLAVRPKLVRLEI